MDSQKQENLQAFKEFDVFKVCSNKTQVFQQVFIIRCGKKTKEQVWVSMDWLLVSGSVYKELGSYYSEKISNASWPDESKGHIEHCHPLPSTGETNKQPSRAGPCWDRETWTIITGSSVLTTLGVKDSNGIQLYGPPQGCEIYQQKLHRKIREKSPWASGRRRGKRNHFGIHQCILLFTRSAPKRS